jgi:ATP-dependent protease ClpP protease subunit
MPRRSTQNRRRPSSASVSAPAGERFWNFRNVAAGSPAGSVPTLELFGEIGQARQLDPWSCGEPGAGTFREFCDALRALGNVPEMRVEIFSNGGNMVVGKAIHDRLLEHPAKKTAVIYGICASAATYPALACDDVQIPANSFFLIHNCEGVCFGDAADMRDTADMMEVADESIAALYAARTGKTVEEIRAIMDADTWMTGSAAVEMGLADVVLEPITPEHSEPMTPENFRRSAINSMPAAARAWFDSAALTNAKHEPKNAMTKLRTPLLNSVNDATSGGGSAPAPAAASPAPAPAAAAPAPAAAAPAPAAAAPAPAAAAPAPAAAAPAGVSPELVNTIVTAVVANLTAAAPAAAPAAAAPAAPADLATSITNAVNAAVAPLQQQVTDLRNLQAHGISGATLPGAAPVAGAVPALDGKTNSPINYANMDPLALVTMGCREAFKEAGVIDAPPAK